MGNFCTDASVSESPTLQLARVNRAFMNQAKERQQETCLLDPPTDIGYQKRKSGHIVLLYSSA